MKYFAVFLPLKDEEKSKIHRPEHLSYLEKKQQEGFIVAKGPFTDGAGGLVIYKGESLQEVEAMVQVDPYIQTGARGYEIHEWDMKLV
jgi:uncharacterized protein